MSQTVSKISFALEKVVEPPFPRSVSLKRLLVSGSTGDVNLFSKWAISWDETCGLDQYMFQLIIYKLIIASYPQAGHGDVA